jgi:hypothetical protein
MLKIKKEIYTIGTGKGLYDMKDYFNLWSRRRKTQNIPMKILFNQELKEEPIANILLSNIRYLPKEFSNPSALFIYGDYVATVIWSKPSPFAFVIKSEEVAKSYVNYFNMIWKIAKE